MCALVKGVTALRQNKATRSAKVYEDPEVLKEIMKNRDSLLNDGC